MTVMSAKPILILLGHNKASFGILHAQAHIHFQGFLGINIYIYVLLICMYMI